MSPVDPLLAVEAGMQLRSGQALYPFQRVGIRWLAPRTQAALFDEPGLGKTIQVLGALPAGEPVLVVCPNVVKHKWAAEVRRWRPMWRPVVLDEGARFRFPRRGELVVVNYERLPPAVREIGRFVAARNRLAELFSGATARGDATTANSCRARFDSLGHELGDLRHARSEMTMPLAGTTVVADEAHRAKNRAARVTSRLRDIVSVVLATAGRSWILTGTPLVNVEDELYTVLQAAGLGTAAFGDLEAFRAASAAGEVPAVLRRIALRRLRRDVLRDLPEVTRETVPVALDSATRDACDRLVERLRAKGYSLRKVTLSVLAAASHGDAEMREAVSSARMRLATLKIPALREIMDQAEDDGTPLVVFCAHRAPIEYVRGRRACVVVTGDEPAAEKSRRADAFQRGEHVAVGLTYQSGGEGIDLFRAWRQVQCDLPWTPKDVEQAEGRLQRIGQKARGVLVTRLVAEHPLEERVVELLDEKSGLVARTVDAAAVRG